ncbi:hypothetical protein IV203_028845 [Nitzschia inconspicua]|uniref:Uncharacterized protein n=1 Tax=Nitzschia inconspicua TaxID=303405 RepID=A0A9K3Q0M8_9STRA|nr:hypothetical protein IV203_004780 [Nitzschia inconspicua]KAG7366175.1 hypothetical protein IV203_028845 [Nitzschia inconspicua]
MPNDTKEVSSTRQDREAMSAACIWLGSPGFAEFCHLSNTSCHCSGRRSEVSLIKSDGMIPMYGVTFPIFSKAALKTKKSGESDSGVSGFWTRLFGEVRNTFEVLADEINEELGSHSNLRGSYQAMVESQSLGGYAPIFRSGLRSKSIHTIFDYSYYVKRGKA